MSTDTVRDYITRQLRPHLPSTWKLDPGIPTLTTVAGPLLWIEYTQFEPLPEAPLSKIKVSADVCIISNKTDVRKGEDAADELVAELYESAFRRNTFYELTARKTVFGDAYIGWRLSVAVITTNPEGI